MSLMEQPMAMPKSSFGSNSQVAQQLASLEDGLAALTVAVDELENRLGPVLRLPEPQEMPSASEMATPLVELATRIYEAAMHVSDKNTKLTRILDRLEV